jgi:hypothetical protein
MSKLTPEQIDRSLNLADRLLDLAIDVWTTRKAKAPKAKRNKPKQKAA